MPYHKYHTHSTTMAICTLCVYTLSYLTHPLNMHTHVCVYKYAYVYIYVYIYICVYIYMYICVCTYRGIYLCRYINICFWPWVQPFLLGRNSAWFRHWQVAQMPWSRHFAMDKASDLWLMGKALVLGTPILDTCTYLVGGLKHLLFSYILGINIPTA